MTGLTISAYGGINNSAKYTRLVAHEIPAFYETLTNELAQLTGMPVRGASFPFAVSNASQSGGALNHLALLSSDLIGVEESARSGGPSAGPAMTSAGTLAEQVITVATKYVVDKIMDEAEKLYKNSKKLAVDVICQAAWTASAVALTNTVREDLGGKVVDEVFSGASLSFRQFLASPAWIEVDGSDDRYLNNVWVIGPNLITKLVSPTQDLFKKLKDGYDKTSPNKYKNADEVKNDLWKALTEIKDSLNSLDKAVQKQAELAFQYPDEVFNGCLLPIPENARQCRQLIYNSGIKPVYTYNPPPGFGQLSGLPVPIIIIVFNQDSLAMSFGTPSFMPCTEKDDKAICPNADPFPW